MSRHGADQVIEEIKINSALYDRKIYFNEIVSRESVFKVVHLLDRIVKLDKCNGTKDDIEIVIDCEGGEIYFGLSLVSKIIELQEKGYNVNTTVHSIAMSMGFMFLIIGSYRKASRYSTMMVHQPSSGRWGEMQTLESHNEEMQRLWKILKEIIILNTNITDERLEQIKREKEDWNIGSEEALDLGVIDEIL